MTKRDMNLIRLLLLRTEGDEDARIAVEKYEVATRAYHAAILKEAGLVIAAVALDENGYPSSARITRLTWEGHEFLDIARSETTWKKVREQILKAGVSWSFPVLVEILKAEAKRHLWPSLGLPPS